jgi:hypothetical protein
MEVRVSTLWAPKDGHALQQCEDVWRVIPEAASEAPLHTGPLRVVVGDGATEGVFSRRWVRSLTKVFAETELSAARNRAAFVSAARTAASGWPEELQAYKAEREAAGPLAWYEERSLQTMTAAYATLLVVDVDWQPPRRRWRLPWRPPPLGLWHAAAVGDTCLFHVSRDRLATSFPIHVPQAFTNTPDLLSSVDDDAARINPMVRMASGSIRPGDQLFLCTDAVAQWFLEACAVRDRPWEKLCFLNEEVFPAWLAAERQADRLHNDDVTVVRVQFGA